MNKKSGTLMGDAEKLADKIKSLLPGEPITCEHHPHMPHDWEYERKDMFMRSDDPVILDDDEVLAFRFDEIVDKVCKECGRKEDATGERVGHLPVGRKKTVTVEVEGISEADFLDASELVEKKEDE